MHNQVLTDSELSRNPTVAIVYDKASVSFGGAERVLSALHELYPQAPLFTSLFSSMAQQWNRDMPVVPSFLQFLNWIPNSYRLLVPFFPLAFESFSLADFDIIVSVTSGEAKGVLTKPDQLHICYLLTPPRYLYSHAHEYESHPSVSSRMLQPFIRTATKYLRWWDQAAIHRPDYIVPISQLVAKRVTTYYKLGTEKVLYPPVAATSIEKAYSLPYKYFLSVSRLVPYKRVDLSIAACVKHQKTLIIVGSGMEYQRLFTLAASNAAVRKKDQNLYTFLLSASKLQATILFVGNVSEDELQKLYAGAIALVLPGLEDFGIAALEAALQGTPTIMQKNSGVAEILTAPKLSIPLLELTVDAMIDSMKKLEKTKFSSGPLQAAARNHTTSYFKKSFARLVNQLWRHHNTTKETYVSS